MRALKITVLAVVVTLAVAGVASATVRDGMLTAARTAGDFVAAVTDPSPSATPSPDASATPSTEPSGGPSAEPSAEPSTPPEEWANHGTAVSAVARDKDAVATWVNPAGKEVTNHGKAVSAVARSDAGKGGDADQGRKDK